LAIAAIGKAQQRKQSRIAIDIDDLPIAKGPEPGGKIAGKKQNLGNVSFHKSY
jgi:hypothetical protein